MLSNNQQAKEKNTAEQVKAFSLTKQKTRP